MFWASIPPVLVRLSLSLLMPNLLWSKFFCLNIRSLVTDNFSCWNKASSDFGNNGARNRRDTCSSTRDASSARFGSILLVGLPSTASSSYSLFLVSGNNTMKTMSSASLFFYFAHV